MSRFDGGVSFYDKGELAITVSFPEGERKCKWCPFYHRDNDVRYRCTITNQIVYSPEWIPEGCPIKFKEVLPNETIQP
jgi:hypothetical protein